jgi:hypothetical protein
MAAHWVGQRPQAAVADHSEYLEYGPAREGAVTCTQWPPASGVDPAPRSMMAQEAVSGRVKVGCNQVSQIAGPGSGCRGLGVQRCQKS